MYRDYGNGEIGDDGIHDLDMAAWGLGVDTHPSTIAGIGVPGMPIGSPGMPGPNPQAYEVYAFDKAGRLEVYDNVVP